MHKDTASDLDTLLHKDNSEHIHLQNLQLQIMEVFKSINNLNPTFVTDLFPKAEQQYSLKSALAELCYQKFKQKTYCCN